MLQDIGEWNEHIVAIIHSMNDNLTFWFDVAIEIKLNPETATVRIVLLPDPI